MLKATDAGALVLLAIIPATATAAGIPRAASPGDPSRPTEIGRACPTFSWEQVEGAEGYEVAVYRLVDSAGAELVLHHTFAGSVDGWTPSLGECLDRGGRYAWSVRAAGAGDFSAWSTPSLFRVAAGPSRVALEEMLERAELHLRARAEVPRSARALTEGTRAAEGELSAVPPGSRPEARAPVETLVSVDGDVEATSFSGDGSSLTSLDPASLSPGTAGVSVTGTSGSLSCVGCVDTGNIGTGQVRSADIGDGEVTANGVDSSAVQVRIEGSCGIDGAMRAVGTDGSTTCEAATSVGRGLTVYTYANSGISTVGNVDRQDGYMCFFVFVGFLEVDAELETAYCNITLDPSDVWKLSARADDDSTAECRMRCMKIDPAGRTF